MNASAQPPAGAEDAPPAQRPHRGRTLLHVSLFSAASYLSEALYLVRGLVLARTLGPELFGVWSSMRLLRDLSRHSQLGALEGMLQLAPHALGRGDEEEALRHRRGAAGMVVATAGLVAVGIFALAAAGVWRFGGRDGAAWMLFSAVVLVSQLYVLYATCLRAEQRFGLVSVGSVGVAFFSTALGIAAALRFGLEGFLIALGGSFGGVLVIVARLGRSFPRPSFDRRALRRLVSTGYTIVIAHVLAQLLWNVDKLLLWILRGSVAIGVYAVPTYLTQALRLLPFAASAVLYPQLLQRLGRSGSPRAAWPYLDRPTVWLGQLACPVLAVLYIGLPYPIVHLLPGYADAIEPGRILIAASFFTIVGHVPGTVLIALRAERMLIAIRLLALLVSAGGGAAALQAGGGLRGVALAASLGMAVQAALSGLAAIREVELPARRAARAAWEVLLPYAVLLSLLALVGGPVDASLGETAWRAALVAGVLSIWAFRSAQRLRSFTRSG